MEKEIKVLVIEDSPEDLHLIARVLGNAGLHHIHHVNSEAEFEQAIEAEQFDIVLSDHSMPAFNSIQALKRVRKQNLNIPFIVVSGNPSEEFAVNCIKAGANDYVLKENLNRLPQSIFESIKETKLDAEEHASQPIIMQSSTTSQQSKELETFIYHISHNLRSPLMSMLGIVNLMEQTDPGNFYVPLLHASIKKLDGTLKELIDYIRTSKNESVVEEIDFKKIVEDQFERMSFLPGAERVQRTNVVTQTTPFFSDAYSISVIFHNLVSNALKYSDQKKEHPYLRISVNSDERTSKIVVEDNGVGIDSESVDKIFNMFYRASQKSEGSGLGLFIVKEAVEKMNGSIEVSSTLGEGTTFTITLPNLRTNQR